MAISDQYLEPNSLCVCPQNQNKTKSEKDLKITSFAIFVFSQVFWEYSGTDPEVRMQNQLFLVLIHPIFLTSSCVFS